MQNLGWAVLTLARKHIPSNHPDHHINALATTHNIQLSWQHTTCDGQVWITNNQLLSNNPEQIQNCLKAPNNALETAQQHHSNCTSPPCNVPQLLNMSFIHAITTRHVCELFWLDLETTQNTLATTHKYLIFMDWLFWIGQVSNNLATTQKT